MTPKWGTVSLRPQKAPPCIEIGNTLYTPVLDASMPNYIWIALLSRTSGQKNHDFDHILNFQGSYTILNLLHRSTNVVKPSSTLTSQIWSVAVYSVALERQEILPHFQLQHSVVAPPSSAETQLNTAAQLSTVLYPTMSRPCRNSEAEMWHSHMPNFTLLVQRVALVGKNPQNRPLSKLNASICRACIHPAGN